MKWGIIAVGVLSLVTACLYIPVIKAITGFVVMAFLASEVGSERATVTLWYPVSLLLGIASLSAAGFRIGGSAAPSFSLFTMALTALIQLPPLCLWLKLGGDDQWLRAGKEIDKSSYAFLQRDDIPDAIGDKDFRITTAHLSTDFGRGFYLMSGSIVKYIFEQIGSVKFMTVYKSADLLEALINVTGRSIDEWKQEWKDYLSSQFTDTN